MADIATDIIAYSVADTTLNAIISGRMYNTMEAHFGTIPYPYIFFWMLSDNDLQHNIGKDTANPIFQFDMVAATMATLNAMDAAFRARWIPDGIRTNLSLTNFTVDVILSENVRDLSTGLDFYHRARDLQIIYQR